MALCYLTIAVYEGDLREMKHENTKKRVTYINYSFFKFILRKLFKD